MTHIGNYPPVPAGPPMSGTHNGHLSPEAAQRRAAKKQRYLQNVEQRREENKRRASR